MTDFTGYEKLSEAATWARSLTWPVEVSDACLGKTATAFMELATPDAVLGLFRLIETLNTQVNSECQDWAREYERRRQVAGELATIKAAIADPDQVFVNMKTGAIAKPSLRSMVDLYGEVVNGDEAQLLEIARLRAENEALRPDAERYRYMRDFPYNNAARAVGITDGRRFWLQFGEADKAVDKARLDDAELIAVMAKELSP